MYNINIYTFLSQNPNTGSDNEIGGSVSFGTGSDKCPGSDLGSCFGDGSGPGGGVGSGRSP